MTAPIAKCGVSAVKRAGVAMKSEAITPLLRSTRGKPQRRRMNGTDGRKAIVDALEKAVVAFGQRYDARRGQSPTAAPAAP